ncbi:MAG: WYL domain-containing protein [Gammaproteobacteria bacterium]|nr:WYL domain-containing protein [Gammaproteobacteria bacterium]MBT3722680.1 WYL domain-containing protein [Gammaproteobacteria bacterium]MBT4075944.1 WYL domain-containing protein [Gammaproteobacteria bacterium]MBT4193891.1 WYL domain-containing protein [Gammaproteobacteria bacterium]MBT4451525.1 WYL domain-containing protein [Gammaproteobacteria bacterium]
MPAKSSRHTMTRQWALLKLLPAGGPGSTARDLCESLNQQGHPVSKRQVERDLGDLMEVFPIDCNNKSKPYGWRWVKGAQIDIPGIGMAEALSLKLMEGCMTPLLPRAIMNTIKPRLLQAEKLLDEKSALNPQARWIDKIRTVSPTLPLCAPEIDEGILEEIQEALLHDRQIDTRYQSSTADEPKSYLMNPLALIQRGPATYLVATINSFTDVRLFALHRFSQAEITTVPISGQDTFNLDQYINDGHLNFGSGKQIRLRANIDDYLEKILQETPLSEDQKIIIKNDEYYVTATLADTWQLHWWILSHGEGIEVVGPKAVRDAIGDRLKAASEYY